jgi:hypothetical protein
MWAEKLWARHGTGAPPGEGAAPLFRLNSDEVTPLARTPGDGGSDQAATSRARKRRVKVVVEGVRGCVIAGGYSDGGRKSHPASAM